MRQTTILLAVTALTAIFTVHGTGITMEKNSRRHSKERPTIDMNIPGDLETATFALG